MRCLFALFLLASLSSCHKRCEKSIEKADLVGAWESDELHYVIYLYENDSCEIKNYPIRELYKNEKWRSQEELNDTNRIDMRANWHILDSKSEGIFEVVISEENKRHGWGLGIRMNPCSDPSTWKLYYKTMDKDETVTYHTFSRRQ